MSDAEKPALDHDAGDEPRRTRGSYTYKNGDWTYEELAGHRARLLADERTVWGALGFQDTHMVTADEVADKALALIARVRDAERERDELRAKIARAVQAELARHDDISDKSAGHIFLKEALEAETRTEVVMDVRRALGDA